MSHNHLHHGIRICPEGHVHLEFGFTTIHLELKQFQSLLQAGVEALQEYRNKSRLQGLDFHGWFGKIH